MLSGTFELSQAKGYVYGKCIQSIVLDMIQKVKNTSQRLPITIDDVFEALMIAILSSDNKKNSLFFFRDKKA